MYGVLGRKNYFKLIDLEVVEILIVIKCRLYFLSKLEVGKVDIFKLYELSGILDYSLF